MHAEVSEKERHVSDLRRSQKNTVGVSSPRFGPDIRPVYFTGGLQRAAFSFRRTIPEAVQNDGVQLGSDNERGEQHRRSQRAHNALLLQTVWDSAGNSLVVLLFVDDPQVLHVPGPHSEQHQKKDLCRIGLPCLRETRKNTGGDEYDRFDVGDLHCLLRCDS